MESKKPSLAIAFSVQKRGKSKMAKGGMVKGATATQEPTVPTPKPDDSRPPMTSYMSSERPPNAMPDGYAQDAASMIDAIMSKRRAKINLAKGGEVPGSGDIDGESGQSPYDNLNAEAFEKELYDDNQLSPQPMDGDQHGDTDERPEGTLVSRIRERMKNRRGF